MPYRKTRQIEGGKIVLHIQNRGISNRALFRVPADYKYFVNTLAKLARKNKHIGIIGYLVKRSEYHLILEEREKGEASKFMHKLTVSYVAYLQSRYQLQGRIFPGPYKDKLLQDDDELALTLSKIHKKLHEEGENPETCEWSSYPKYLKKQAPWLHKEPIEAYFRGTNLADALRAF